MSWLRGACRSGAAGLLAAALSAAAGSAAEIVVPEGAATSLAAALELAVAGDTVRVVGGIHPGPVTVDKSVRLLGESWPVIDGGDRGTVVAIAAAGVTLGGFEIRASGSSLDQENSGVAVEAPDTTIAGNRIVDTLFGIYLRNAPGSRISHNEITGKDLPLARRGDAIRVWHSDRVTLEGNSIERGRDVVLWYSNALRIRDNRVRNGRYGLHFMYCDDAEIAGNLLWRNSVGAFLMYSRRLRLTGNTLAGNHGPSGYGVGLKDMDDAVVEDNLFVGNRTGAFLDNSPRESASRTSIERNVFQGNDTGVLLLPNVRRARFSENAFIENQEQVGLAGMGGDAEANEWSGNYWSDYAGFDLDGDLTGDLPYRSERLFESLADRRPELRLFLYSPATQALDLAARAFPAVRPQPKLTDPRPRLRPLALASVPLPPAAGGDWRPTAASLLGAGVLLAAFARLGRGRPRGAEPEAGKPRLELLPGRPLVEVVGLTKRFGDKTALDGVSFGIDRGESVALWGPNGAGKTTALRALLGVLRFDGRVAVDGLDPLRQGRRVRGKIGFVPQEIGFRENATVDETLEFFARLRDVAASGVEGAKHRFGLVDSAELPVRALSGGLQQRLALAVALLADPELLLLDEPTANLDAEARDAVHELLCGLRREGKTILFTSHRVEEVVQLADRVIRLEGGRLVGIDEPEEWSRSAARVELELRLPGVAETEIWRAAGRLRKLGFSPRQRGTSIWVPVPAARKLEPLRELLECGFEISDFEVVAAAEEGAR